MALLPTVPNILLVALAFALPGFACAASRGRAGGGTAAPRTASSTTGGAAGAASSALVEVTSASLGTLTARKWRLDNGLEVVLLPDAHATSVSFTTWFRVGSRNEDEARARPAWRTCSST